MSARHLRGLRVRIDPTDPPWSGDHATPVPGEIVVEREVDQTEACRCGSYEVTPVFEFGRLRGGRALRELRSEAMNDDGMTASPAREHANCRVAVRVGNGRHLTPAELRVVKYIAIGLERREIALATGLGLRAVDANRERALKTLQLRNNVDLAKWAIMAGYVAL